jgi:hypothetical protein
VQKLHHNVDQHLWIGGFRNHRSAMARGADVAISAVKDVRDIARFEPSADGIDVIVPEARIKDRSRYPIVLDETERIDEGVSREDGCPNFLKGIGDIEGNEWLILDNEDRATSRLAARIGHPGRG